MKHSFNLLDCFVAILLAMTDRVTFYEAIGAGPPYSAKRGDGSTANAIETGQSCRFLRPKPLSFAL